MAVMYIGNNNQAKKVKKFYIGVNNQAKKVKRGYIGVNGQPKLFYRSAKVAYLNKKITNVLEIYVNNSQGTGNISNTANSDAYIWVNSYRNNNILTTNADEVYLYSDSSNFYQYFFNSNSQQIFNNENITFDTYFKFDLVTNGYNFYANGIYRHPILNLNNVNFKNLVNAANMFISGDQLRGSPPLMPNVTNMSRCYYHCSYISGTSIIGPKVTDASYAYYRCYNIEPNSTIPSSVVNMAFCYSDINIGNLDFNFDSSKLANIYGLFSTCNGNLFLNNCHYYKTTGLEFAFAGYSNRLNCEGNLFLHALTNSLFNNGGTIEGRNLFKNSIIHNLKIYVNKNFSLWSNVSGRYNNYYLTSLLGTSISDSGWTNITNGVYNASYNIYVYNIL